MSEKLFIIDLGKLMISAAWADGKLCNDEINALKDLLFSLEDVSGEDWKLLKMYMESPPAEAEKEELLERVLKQLRTQKDKKLVIDRLKFLFSSDGEITSEETSFLKEIEKAVSKTSTNLFSRLEKAIKSSINKRRSAVRSSCLRETRFEDYIKNTIYYDLQQKQKKSGIRIDLPEKKLRKLCLYAGMLSFIANADSVISDEEQNVMRMILMNEWGLSKQQADMIVQISCSRTSDELDLYRIAHSFFDCTVSEERKEFVKTLFKIANAADKTSREEIEGIRRIAECLKISHQDFIEAKLTISREDRKGM